MSARTEHGRADATAEERQSLWWLALAPSIWSAHLLASYLTAAIFCAKAGRTAELGWTRVAIAAYTALALAGIALTARHAHARHRHERHRQHDADPPHDFDTRADRHRFLGFATLLLCGASFVGVVYVALAAVFVETCR